MEDLSNYLEELVKVFYCRYNMAEIISAIKEENYADQYILDIVNEKVAMSGNDVEFWKNSTLKKFLLLREDFLVLEDEEDEDAEFVGVYDTDTFYKLYLCIH